MEDMQVVYTELPEGRGRLAGVTPFHGKYHPYNRLYQPHLQVQRVPSPLPPLDQLHALKTLHLQQQHQLRHSQQEHQQKHPQRQLRQQQEQQEQRTHVSCLYPELLALIFSHLSVQDRGRAAQVCTTWRDAAYHRSVWRGVEAKLHLRRVDLGVLNSLADRGIRRVQVLSLKKGLREAIAALPALQSLNLSGCLNVTDGAVQYAFVSDLPALTHLDLSLCKSVTDESLRRIAHHLQNLQELELGGCSNITNRGLAFIAWKLKKLRRLNLRSCWQLSDEGIAQLAGHRADTGEGEGRNDLEYLGLQDCQRLSDEALKHIAEGLPKLRSINLSLCLGISDGGLKYLAKMNCLEELNLRSCDNITDVGVSYLAEGGSKVRSLDVSFCDKVGDPALQHISQGLFSLRSLSLSACPVSDEGILKIAGVLADLETLNIGQCHRITDRGLRAVADSLRQLRCIDLYGCTDISRSCVDGLMSLPKMKSLNLGLYSQVR